MRLMRHSLNFYPDDVQTYPVSFKELEGNRSQESGESTYSDDASAAKVHCLRNHGGREHC